MPSTNCKFLRQIRGNIRNKYDFLRSQFLFGTANATTRPGLQNLAKPLGTAPLAPYLGTIFRRVLNLTLHPFYRRERRHHYPINRRMTMPQKRSGKFAGDVQLKMVRLLCVISIYRTAVCSVCTQQCCVSSINCCV